MKLRWYSVVAALFITGLGVWNLVDGAWLGAGLEFGLLVLFGLGTWEIRRESRRQREQLDEVFGRIREQLET